MINRLVQLFIVWPVRAICAVRNFFPVWFGVLNRKGRRAYRQEASTLNDVEQRIVADLRRDGIAQVALDELFPGEDMLVKLQAHAAKLAAQATVWETKTFLHKLWDRRTMLDFENPFLGFTLDPRVVNIANAYFEMYTKFYYFTLNVTVPVAVGSEERQSQRWHRDPEDKKTCKMFLYLNDVDAGSGPFIYVRGSQYGGRWGHLFPQRWPKGVYPPPEDVARLIPATETKVCTGRAGTLIFCDTAGIHKGGYATTKERLMFTSGFYSSASIRAIQLKYSDALRAQLPALSSAVRFALSPPGKRVVSSIFFRFKRAFAAGGY